MILDLIYGYSKPLEKAFYYSKSKGRKEESIGRVFKKLILVKSSYTRNNYFEITFMFSAQSLPFGNGTSVTCLRKSREPITALNVATYVTPLMVRNFWLCVGCRYGLWIQCLLIIKYWIMKYKYKINKELHINISFDSAKFPWPNLIFAISVHHRKFHE